jgi:cytochrome c peroxidase
MLYFPVSPCKKIALVSMLLSFTLSTSAQQRGGQRPPPPAAGTQPAPPQNNNRPNQTTTSNDTNTVLRTLINQQNLQAVDPTDFDLPSPSDPKVHLGKQLFFSKNLSGEQSAACVSCHHPVLGGGDNLSLSIGVDAVNINQQSSHDLLGHGRFHGESVNNLPLVPRNAPTVFNTLLEQRNLFWDGRVEALPNGGIATPDSVVNRQGRRLPDANIPQNATLPDAQARFPLTSEAEMRDQFLPGIDNQTLREALVKRFDNSLAEFNSTWPQAFELAYGDPEVSVDRIAESIGEYERSMLFVNNPWQAYLAGNDDAMSEQQKQGALLFFRTTGQGGGGCNVCHNGPDFSDSRFHLVAFPQIGPGAGDNSGLGDTDDFGREKVSGSAADRYHFGTPSLLNVAATAPYGHSGSYATLQEVVRHYINPARAVDNFFAAQNGQAFEQGPAGSAPFCHLPQIAEITNKNSVQCEELYPDAYANSVAATEHLQQARNNRVVASSPLRNNARLNGQEVQQIVAFLTALTDPCVTDRDCLTPWIIDDASAADHPDTLPLIAHDENGTAL